MLISSPPPSSKVPPSNIHTADVFLPSASELRGTARDYPHNRVFRPQTARLSGRTNTRPHPAAEQHYSSDSSRPPEGFHTLSRQKYPAQERP